VSEGAGVLEIQAFLSRIDAGIDEIGDDMRSACSRLDGIEQSLSNIRSLLDGGEHAR
jgi:hypothetical protein